jgi:hypothetical protein
MAGLCAHMGSPWEKVEHVDGRARVTTPKGTFDFDLLVLSTGLISDPALRPELAEVAPRFATWGDKVAIEGPRNALIDAHPYLGPAFEFLPRDGADPARLHGLFAFNYSALISQGLSASALSGMQNALPRLIRVSPISFSSTTAKP